MDAAMGTALLAAGVRSVNAAPLTHPEVVRSIHAAHVAAGAEVVLTCTFQNNPAALGREGLRRQQWPLWRSAADLTGSVGARFVLGDIGPHFTAEGEETVDGYALTLSLGDLEGIDGLLLETWSSPLSLGAARHATRVTASRPVLLSLAY